MTFARRSHALIPISMSSSRRGRRRPSRARRPSLGPERCEERLLLSTALVSANAAGSAAGNGVSDFSGVSPNGDPLPAPSQSPQSNLSTDGSQLVLTSDTTNLVGALGGVHGVSNVYVRDTATGQTTLVSATPAGQPGDGDSFDPVISPDGRYVAFVSQATNLSTVDASSDDLTGSSTAYLYVRDLQTGTTTLLDQTPHGQASDGGSTGVFVFSPDSRSLAFIDTSDDLTTAPVDPSSGSGSSSPGYGPSMQPQYVYVRDLAAQTTSLASISTAGAASAMNSLYSSDTSNQLVFSPDSRSLVFASDATDLTANAPGSAPSSDSNLPDGMINLFLRDLQTGTTTLLTPTTGGALSQGGSIDPIFSPDGHSVAFLSYATGLTANPAKPVGPAGPGLDLYVRNLTTGKTTLVSAAPDGVLSRGQVSSPVFSPDGGSLAYISTATDLTNNTPDPNLPPDQTTAASSMPSPSILANMSTFPVSVNPLATASVLTPATSIMTAANPATTASVLTPATSIRTVSGPSSVTTTTPSPTTGPLMPMGGVVPQFGGQNVFLTDLSTGKSTLIGATPTGQLSSGWANDLAFSPDGRYLAFTSDASDLTTSAVESKPPPVPGVPSRILAIAMTSIANVFVHDLQTGQTSLASATTGGLLSDGTSGGLIFSPDSHSLFFTSTALDLTSNPPDTSNGPLATYGGPPDNLFVRNLATGTTSLVSATSGGLLSGTSHTSAVLSPDGQTVYFDSDAANLTARDPGGSTNLFAASAPFTSPSVTVPTTPPTAVPTAPVSTTNNPPSTASSTATPAKTSPTPTVTTPEPVADPGPTVSSVAAVKGRRGISELVITFNRALDPATAQNTANYQVSLSGRTVRIASGHRTSARPGRSIAVTAAAYDPASHQVTLTLRTKLHPPKTTQLEINGTTGGVASTDGVPLNSPNKTSPGQNDLTTLDLAARRV